MEYIIWQMEYIIWQMKYIIWQMKYIISVGRRNILLHHHSDCLQRGVVEKPDMILGSQEICHYKI